MSCQPHVNWNFVYRTIHESVYFFNLEYHFKSKYRMRKYK